MRRPGGRESARPGRRGLRRGNPYRRKPRHRDWYTTDDALPWPTDALLCQLQNVTWGRRNHKAYLPYLITGGVVLVLSDTAWALARNMSVHDFLVLLFLPTAPALLDLAELVLSHLKHSDAKGRAEHHQGALDALRTWSPVVGGGRSTGFGATRPVSVRYNTVDLDTPEGRRMWLTGGGRELFTSEKHFTPEPATLTPLLRSQWEIVDALHIGSGGRKNETADPHPEQRSSEPAPLARDDQKRPFVPGTAWKGVLRGRCEYILGSLGLSVCVSSERTCGTCVVCDAFGWSSDGPQSDDRESVGARARLRFTDSPITGERLAVRQHVALDRFTGGARTGLLFAEEVAESGRVTLEVYADGDAVHPVIAAALELALYDLHTGRLGLGGGTTRGYGTLRRTDADEDAIRERRDAAARVLASQLPGVDQPAAETTGMERKEPAC